MNHNRRDDAMNMSTTNAPYLPRLARMTFTLVMVTVAMVFLTEAIYSGRHHVLVSQLPSVRLKQSVRYGLDRLGRLLIIQDGSSSAMAAAAVKEEEEGGRQAQKEAKAENDVSDEKMAFLEHRLPDGQKPFLDLRFTNRSLSGLVQLEKREPRCLIIGAVKGGTYALRTFLTINPHAVTNKYEINFFNQNANFRRGRSWYRNHMPRSSADQITIEKSQYYISPVAAERVARFNKHMKLVFIAREPVTRAVSHYVHMKALGLVPEGITFEEMVLDSKTDSLKLESRLIRFGLYSSHLESWYRFFSRQQIHVLDGEEFIRNPLPSLKQTEKYLDIPSKITEHDIYFNKKKGFYCYTKHGRRKCLPNGKGRKHPLVSDKVRRKLQDYFHSWNERFFAQIGKRFDWNTSNRTLSP